MIDIDIGTDIDTDRQMEDMLCWVMVRFKEGMGWCFGGR